MQIYLYCIVGFISIWLIFDISDNVSGFLEEHVSLFRIGGYYLTQVPQILVILLPVSLLLALLFCLGRMSRSNEIVSMLTAGISVPRVLVPLIGAGLVTAILSTALNYALAPHAEYERKTFFASAQSRRHEAGLNAQVFRNRTDRRTWFIQHFQPGTDKFANVQILQQDAADNITTNYMSHLVLYRPDHFGWELDKPKIVHYDPSGNITKEEILETITIHGWSETPFRLASANERAEFLGVQELRQYLQLNSDFPSALLAPFATHLQYRIALPWTCLVVVIMAAPLGIGFSRRGVLSSVAAAIVLVFSMNFLTHLFLALGEGERIPAWIAAWTPNLIFAVIGLFLLYLRSTNRDAPRFKNSVPQRKLAS